LANALEELDVISHRCAFELDESFVLNGSAEILINEAFSEP